MVTSLHHVCTVSCHQLLVALCRFGGQSSHKACVIMRVCVCACACARVRFVYELVHVNVYMFMRVSEYAWVCLCVRVSVSVCLHVCVFRVPFLSGPAKAELVIL